MQEDKLREHMAEPHALLHTSSGLSMPTPEEIEKAASPEEIHSILERIAQVQKLHADNLEVYSQARELDEQAIRKFYLLAVVNEGQEKGDAGQ